MTKKELQKMRDKFAEFSYEIAKYIIDILPKETSFEIIKENLEIISQCVSKIDQQLENKLLEDVNAYFREQGFDVTGIGDTI